jgi:NAD(P)-dependent dehydrogenase (short-subunit alcohol dehydrogenase family)
MNPAPGPRGKVALVTGAGRGIGRAIALMAAGEGFQVGLLARSEGELEETAALIRASGGEALLLPADVSDPEAVKRAFARLFETWGDLSLLVNNAGWARFSRVEETSTANWNRILAVNLTGTFLCCREAIPSMRHAGAGIIVNIASSAGKKGYAEQGAYVAAKHGVIGLSKVLAMELRAAGIRVHVVCPGGVETRLAEEVHGSRDRTDWMTPGDLAEIVRFLITRPGHLIIDEIVVRRFESDVMF